MADRAVTIPQPDADLVVAGVADVLNLTFGPPSDLPQWGRCPECEQRFEPVLTDRDVAAMAIHQRCQQMLRHDGPWPATVWIHAAAEWDDSTDDHAMREAQAWLDAFPGSNPDDPSRLGAILGRVTIPEAPHHADKCYAKGHYPPDAVCNCSGPHDPHWIHEPGCGLEPYCSRWAKPDRWHWPAIDPVPLDTPVPARGRTGLWTVDKELVT